MKMISSLFLIVTCLVGIGSQPLSATSVEEFRGAYGDWRQAQEELEAVEDGRDAAAEVMLAMDLLVEDAESGYVGFPLYISMPVPYGVFCVETLADLYDLASLFGVLLEAWDVEVESASQVLSDVENSLVDAVDGFECGDGDEDRFNMLLSYNDMWADEELIAQMEDLFWRILEAVANGDEDLANELREQFDNPEQEF